MSEATVYKTRAVGPTEMLVSNLQREEQQQFEKDADKEADKFGDHRQEILDKKLRLLSLSIGLALRGERCFRPFQRTLRPKPPRKRMRPEDVSFAR